MAALNKYSPLSPKLIQPAKTWVEEEGSKVHEALTVPSRFDYQRAEFRERQPFRELSEAIHRYKDNAGEESLIDFNSKHAWTWEDVLEEAEKAVNEYNAAEKGVKGALRKFFRRVGDKEPMLSPWVDLIPTDHYMSIFNGGLKLIFAAARRMSEKRRQIIEALQDMPETMERTCLLRRVYRSDQGLAKLAADLHYSLLDAIDCMIAWLLEKPKKKQFKSILQGSTCGDIVDQRLLNVKKCVAALWSQAETLQFKNTAKTAAAVERFEPQLNSLRQIGTVTAVQTQEIQDGVSNTQKILNDLSHSHAAGLASQNGMFKTIADQLLKANWMMKCQIDSQSARIQHLAVEVAASKERDYSQQFECYATRPQLLELLMVDFSSATSDIQYVLGQADVANTTYEAKSLLQMEKFQHWLSGSLSGFVFVDGNAECHALDRVSPFTVLCAMLSLNLHNMPEALSIHFYCGLHAGSHDRLSGITGLLRSLISQLLLVYEDFDLRFIHSRRYFAELVAYDISRLCDTFQHLVRQIPNDRTVFCLIDGITFLDNWRWREDLSFILPKLKALAESGSRDGPVFKLLMTNARCTRQLRDLLPRQDILDVSEAAISSETAITEREVAAQILSTRPPFQSWSNRPSNETIPRLEKHEDVNYVDEDDDDDDDDDFFGKGGDSDKDDYDSWSMRS